MSVTRILTMADAEPLTPSYLKIADEWQDHVLFQLLNGA